MSPIRSDYRGIGPLPPLKPGFVVELDDCAHNNIPRTFWRAPCGTEDEAVAKAHDMAARMVALNRDGRLPGRYTNRLVVVRRLADGSRRAICYVGWNGQGSELESRTLESVPDLWQLADWQDHKETV